jgi:hypothetical protein
MPEPDKWRFNYPYKASDSDLPVGVRRFKKMVSLFKGLLSRSERLGNVLMSTRNKGQDWERVRDPDLIA